jgi:hypothetical protein
MQQPENAFDPALSEADRSKELVELDDSELAFVSGGRFDGPNDSWLCLGPNDNW